MTDGDDASRTALRALALAVGALSVLIVVPLFQAVVLGGLLAYLAAPVNERLARRVGATAAALATTVATLAVVVAPLALLVGVAVDQAVSVVRGVEIPDTDSLAVGLREWLGAAGVPAISAGSLGDLGGIVLGGITGQITGAVGLLPTVAVGAVVTLFAFFYLLRDGDALLAWVRANGPLDASTTDELLRRTDDLLWAAVVGNVVVAALQAVLTVLGLVVVGFDDIVFWGVLTFVLSLLPLIGASFVWIPAAGYLAVTGGTVAAAGLAVYGAVVVSGSDNVVRPLAMRRGARLNPALLVVGIFGGIAVFGFLGLFVGPVVLGLGKTLVELLAADRDGARGS
ncbi:AI-2E family transporter [Halosimplex pelagicum]|uniref:AI-2E family transporter n=1 Tax=Halosimplex pelagicum TaxID=869886 RepID=A0A7D5PAU2_9EURY|nr:AI-2E family transporter [Halosimplex pelagicum]QLH81762.1 AI-2E family transporter [Halosimplex pelagicum]